MQERRHSPDYWGHLRERDIVIKRVIESLADHGFAVSISPARDEGYLGDINLNASPAAKDILKIICSSLHFELLSSAMRGDRNLQDFREGLEHSRWNQLHRQQIKALYVYNNSIESGLPEEEARTKAIGTCDYVTVEAIRDDVVPMLAEQLVDQKVRDFYFAQEGVQSVVSPIA